MTAPGTHDFWAASGHRLLARDASGGHAATDDFLRAYWRRPELRPVAESCAVERALHAELVEKPRALVPADRLQRVKDKDARENYAVMLSFRDHLLRHASLEAALLALFRQGVGRTPPLFLDQLVHVLLRGILDGATDAFQPRAGELLFRPQRVSIVDAGMMLADDEVVEMHATTGGFGALGQLVVESGTPLRTISLDVLTLDNAAQYWARSDRYDMVLDLSFGRPGLDALCRVLERWTAHMLGVAVSVQPVQTIKDERWSWHVGLDAESNAIMNALYEGAEVGEDRLARVLSLFRLEFADPQQMLARVAGRPVYLGLAMNAQKVLRLKPQNLLVNLPLARAA